MLRGDVSPFETEGLRVRGTAWRMAAAGAATEAFIAQAQTAQGNARDKLVIGLVCEST
jgi:hypothetical protein